MDRAYLAMVGCVAPRGRVLADTIRVKLQITHFVLSLLQRPGPSTPRVPFCSPQRTDQNLGAFVDFSIVDEVLREVGFGRKFRHGTRSSFNSIHRWNIFCLFDLSEICIVLLVLGAFTKNLNDITWLFKAQESPLRKSVEHMSQKVYVTCKSYRADHTIFV